MRLEHKSWVRIEFIWGSGPRVANRFEVDTLHGPPTGDEGSILPHRLLDSRPRQQVSAAGQDDIAQCSRAKCLLAPISDLDRKIVSLVAAVESGAKVVA